MQHLAFVLLELIYWYCCKKYAIGWVVLIVVTACVTLALVLGLRNNSDNTNYHGLGAVVSNGEVCADIGGKILHQGGSAIDAAIAVLLCEGVVLPHSMGVGGGFVATVYSKKTGKIETLIARESAPKFSNQNMFVNQTITGALAAAVPSELYGYWRLHDKYGKLPWKQLFQPSIDLCLNGHRVSKYLSNALEIHQERIRAEPSMAEIFIDPTTNNVFKEGDIIYRPQLGNTLQIIAHEGPEVLYRGGRVGKWLVQDIQEMGGIISEADLQTYDVRWEEPVVAHFTNGYTLYTTPLPTSGVVLAFILNIMEPLYTNNTENVYWHRLMETFKHAYGHRTHLGDAHFEPCVAPVFEEMTSPCYAEEIRNLIRDDRTYTDFAFYGANFTNEEDHGTANMAILAPNGDAITVTSTVNSHFGAKVRSRRTGIILNDEMDDFSTPGVVNAYGIPASPANYIKPGKRPMSSTCPSIVLGRDGEVQLLIGGAGGSRITTSVAQTILRYFVLNQTLEESVNSGRLHHQLAPMQIDSEPEVPEQTNDFLRHIGHEINYLEANKAFSALTAIGLKTGDPHPICDRRRMGSSLIVVPSS